MDRQFTIRKVSHNVFILVGSCDVHFFGRFRHEIYEFVLKLLNFDQKTVVRVV